MDVRGYGSDEDPVTFSDAEAVVLRTQDQPGAASKEKIRGWRTDFCRQLPHLTRLEQARHSSVCLNSKSLVGNAGVIISLEVLSEACSSWRFRGRKTGPGALKGLCKAVQ